MPDIIWHVVKSRMAVDFCRCRFEQGIPVDRIGRDNGGGWSHPDRLALPTSCVNVAGILQRHCRVNGMQRSAMAMREPRARANENLPKRPILRGHGEFLGQERVTQNPRQRIACCMMSYSAAMAASACRAPRFAA